MKIIVLPLYATCAWPAGHLTSIIAMYYRAEGSVSQEGEIRCGLPDWTFAVRFSFVGNVAFLRNSFLFNENKGWL